MARAAPQEQALARRAPPQPQRRARPPREIVYERPREIAYEIRNRVASGYRRAAKNPIVNEIGSLVVGAAGATTAAVGTSIAKSKGVSENVSTP